MKKDRPIQETIEKELNKLERARRRSGLLRETALLKFRWIPNIRKAVQYFAEALYSAAGSLPLDPKLLGESVVRAKLRAMGEELRHLEECAEEVMDLLKWQDTLAASALDPADRRLCEWTEEQRREILKLAVRFERRVGSAPEVTDPPPPLNSTDPGYRIDDR